MEQLINDYLNSRNKNTKRRYKYVLKLYMQFLEKKFGKFSYMNLKKTDTRDALHFIDWLKGRQGIASRDNPSDTKAANRAIGNAIRTIRTIHDMLFTEGKLSRNIFKSRFIKMPNERARPKRQTEIVPISVIKTILKTESSNYKRERLRCLIAVMFAGGLRVSEALNLIISDVRTTSNGTLYLRLRDTKAGQDLDHAIGAWALPILSQYISKRSLQRATNNDFLFANKNNKQVSIATASRHIKAILEKYGAVNCSSHSIRKTAINALVIAGEHVERIRQFARHDSILTTQGYFETVALDDSLAHKLSI